MQSTEKQAVGEEELFQFTETIFESMLSLVVQRSSEPVNGKGTERFITGCIQITGAWEGTITLECSTELARKASAIMFDVEPAAATDAEIQDALGELTNMTGGNIKNLLPGTCHLSLPSVTEGVDYTVSVPGSQLQSQVTFECEGQPLVVSMLRKEDS